MKDILGNRIRLGSEVWLLSCGSGHNLTKVKCVVLSFIPKSQVRVQEVGDRDSYIDTDPNNLLVI